MLSVNSNYGSQFAAKAAKNTQALMDKSVERLSTGKRINSAKDDAAGLAISMRLNAEIQGLAMASRNAADGQSMIDTAEGALQETTSLLLRMRELAVQASNGTLIEWGDTVSLDREFQSLEAEITRIAETTSWGGLNLLDGSNFSNMGIYIQVGTRSDSNIFNPNIMIVSIPEMSATAATINIGAFSIGRQSDTPSAITGLDGALSQVNWIRGRLGAASNRLDSTIANLDQIRVNLSASKGRIEDADFAVETGNLAKSQILQQAATAMLAQANASKSSILALVQL